MCGNLCKCQERLNKLDRLDSALKDREDIASNFETEVGWAGWAMSFTLANILAFDGGKTSLFLFEPATGIGNLTRCARGAQLSSAQLSSILAK